MRLGSLANGAGSIDGGSPKGLPYPNLGSFPKTRRGGACHSRRSPNSPWPVVGTVHWVDYFDRVKAVIVDQLGADESSITLESSFVDDLGADSLDIVELIMGLETEFDIEIPDDQAEKISTVGDAVNYIKENA